jgi:hypothetical protein
MLGHGHIGDLQLGPNWLSAVAIPAYPNNSRGAPGGVALQYCLQSSAAGQVLSSELSVVDSSGRSHLH